MSEEINENNEYSEIIFSPNIIEFVTVANQYCIFVENYADIEKREFLEKAHKLLAILYVKSLSAEKPEVTGDYNVEKFVNEMDWTVLSDRISEKLGEHDKFFDVIDPTNPNETININFSESLADIYQDLKDFTSLYKISVAESVNEGLWECLNNFQYFWGPRITALMKELHTLVYSDTDLSQKATTQKPEEELQKPSNWVDKMFGE